MSVPNTYRNSFSGAAQPTSSYNHHNYSSRTAPTRTNPSQLTNGHSAINSSSYKQQGNVSLYPSQNHTLSNHKNHAYYGPRSNNVHHLGIPDRSSSPNVPSQNVPSFRSPNRANSPNLFENKEYGGTLEQIRNRFTNSPQNNLNKHSSPSQQYPLLEDLKNVSESEIRRNKKG